MRWGWVIGRHDEEDDVHIDDNDVAINDDNVTVIHEGYGSPNPTFPFVNS